MQKRIRELQTEILHGSTELIAELEQIVTERKAVIDGFCKK